MRNEPELRKSSCVPRDAALMKAWVESHEVLAFMLFSAVALAAWEVYPALIVLFVGFLIAAGLAPFVGLLETALPRILAILFTYLLLVAATAGICAGIAIPLSSQAQQFTSAIQADLQGNGPLSFVGASGVDMQSIISYLEGHAGPIASTILSVLTSAVASVVVSIYFLYDWHDLERAPQTRASPWHAFAEGAREASAVLGRWVRGQLLLSASVGVLVLIGMYLYGVPFAPVLAALSFITEFIPYVGPALAAAPAVLIGLNTSLASALVIAGIYLAIQQIENHLLVPIIMHKSVHLHPITVIIVMIAGFEILGIAGIILAVPFTAFVRIVAPRVWYG